MENTLAIDSSILWLMTDLRSIYMDTRHDNSEGMDRDTILFQNHDALVTYSNPTQTTTNNNNKNSTWKTFQVQVNIIQHIFHLHNDSNKEE